jgi:hypothetical protein
VLLPEQTMMPTMTTAPGSSEDHSPRSIFSQHSG